MPRALRTGLPLHRTNGIAKRRSAFTLLELLLVISLLSLVLGIGLGMFAALDPAQRAALSLVQNIVRSAHNSAVARSGQSRVRIDAREGTISAEALNVIGTWHFESELYEGAFELDGVAVGGGTLDSKGYQGKALSFLGEPRGSHVEVPVQNDPAFDFSGGFAVELALRIDEARSARLLTIGRSFRVDTTSRGGLHAYFVPEVVDELGTRSPGGKVSLRTPEGVLRLGQWARLRLVYDRRFFRSYVNGVEVAAVDEDARVWEIDAPLVLSGGDTPFPGSIDNLVVSAVGAAEVVKLPAGVRFAAGTVDEIVFAPGGALDPTVHDAPVELVLEFEDGSRKRVQVNLYGTVE